MKKFIFGLIFFITILSAGNKIYVGKIEGEIDLGLVPYIERIISEAEKNSADAIIFQINTFGGRVDAATQIKDAILNSKIKTIAFIDKRAISAGSLIALSCEKISMSAGSAIGAATVVNQAGKKQSEKYQSYMRGEMRSTAEKNNRPVNIAQGMVDERIVVEGVVDSTQLITLTTKEALHFGIADTVANSVFETAKAFGYSHPNLIEIESNWAEEFVRFINNAFVSSLLIMIGMVGLFVEVKSPGWGVPGTAAVIALALFFGAGAILKLASVLEILIFVIGVILLLLEIFVVPGFGFVGIAGIICIVASLFLGLISDFPIIDTSFISTAIVQLASAFLFSGIILALLAKFLPKTNFFNRLILNTNIDSQVGYSTKENIDSLIGQTGKAISDLRPSGIALINGDRIDVITLGDYIEKGESIKIIKIKGSKIVVIKG